MAVVQPFNSQWRQYLQNQAGTANFNGGWIDTRKCKTLFVHVAYTSAANTGAAFGVQGTEDDSLTNFVQVVPDKTWINTGASVTITNGTAPIPSATAGSTMMFIENVPSFTRLNYVVTTGGSTLNVWIVGRAL